VGAVGEWEKIEEVQAAEVVVANTTASGLQEMEAQSKVTEHQVEMTIEVEMEMAIEAAAATAIDLTPALFATLHRLQDHFPFADSLLEGHDACIQRGLRYV
jgi:hypothetical protein